jgi:hypothetical protein
VRRKSWILEKKSIVRAQKRGRNQTERIPLQVRIPTGVSLEKKKKLGNPKEGVYYPYEKNTHNAC